MKMRYKSFDIHPFHILSGVTDCMSMFVATFGECPKVPVGPSGSTCKLTCSGVASYSALGGDVQTTDALAIAGPASNRPACSPKRQIQSDRLRRSC